jgi:hypothetical protein
MHSPWTVTQTQQMSMSCGVLHHDSQPVHFDALAWEVIQQAARSAGSIATHGQSLQIVEGYT